MSSDKEKNISIASGWGPRIKELRESVKLSQTELALRAGLGTSSSGYISEIEREKKMPGAGVLYSLSRALGVSMDQIFDGKEPQAKAPAKFPEKQVIRATEMVIAMRGSGTLTPYEMGDSIAAAAEMLVLGETESAIQARLGPKIRSLASSGSKPQP